MTGSAYFEDLIPGQRFTTMGRTVTESDVVGFAGLSGDFNPIHVDAEYAADGLFGKRVAHGLLGLSFATGLLHSLGPFGSSMAAMLELNDWVFDAPIFIGDTVHVEMEIQSLRSTSDGMRGVVRRDLRLINHNGVIVQHGVITSLINRKNLTSRNPAPAVKEA